jgi:hypothetical protein
MYAISNLYDALGTVYLVAFLGSIGLVLWLTKPARLMWAALAIVFVGFGYPVVASYLEKKERQERFQAIGEHFQRLCKEKAGDKIVRTVEGVDGFFIMRPRKPTHLSDEFKDQYWMGDPYGHSDMEAENPGYIFLWDQIGESNDAGVKVTPISGFDFIELPNPDREVNSNAPKYLRIVAAQRLQDKDGRRSIEYEKTPTDTLRSHYGLDWEDISTPEDRKIWIAGGRTRVIDLRTRQVIAERTGYVVDPYQNSIGGIPWGTAQKTACPPFEIESRKTKEFVAKVLKSSRGK